ncbi:MAG: peptidylprolyl isomerase [Flavobacteriales bacterium]
MIEKIRQQRGLLLVMVGMGLLSFLIPYDAVMSLFGNGTSDIGEIDGQSISAQEWRKALEDREPLFQYQGNEQSLSNDTWNQLTENILYQDEYTALGIEITDEEYEEITFGELLSPFVKSTIYGGKDSTAMKEQVRKGFDGMDAKMSDNWKKLIKQKRQKEKYDAMLKKGVFANNIDAKWAFKTANDKVTIDFVVKSFTEIPDSTVEWTDSDIRSFYNKHKNDREYRQETSRTVKYLNFPVAASTSDSASSREALEKLAADFRTASSDSMFALNNAATGNEAYTKYTDGMLPTDVESRIKNDSLGTVMGPFIHNGKYLLVKSSKRGLDKDMVEARHILIKDKATGKATLDSLQGVIAKNKNFEEMAKQYSQDPGSGAQGGGLGKFGRGQMVKPFEDACFNGAVGSLQVVESEFGWHLIEVTGKNFPYTKVAQIDRPIEPSSKTVKSAYAMAKDFTLNCADTAAFRMAADTLQGGTKMVEAKNIKPNSTSVAALADAGELVSWCYSADLGEISQPMLIGKDYVIAALTEVKEKGVPTFENVYDVMKAETIKEKKAEKYAAMMNEGSLTDIAARIQSEVKKAENVTMRSSNLPSSGVSVAENVVIGACFGLGTGKMSKAIVGKGGVYVIQRSAEITAGESLDNYAADLDRTTATYQQKASNSVFNSYKEAAQIEDNRYERR